MPESPFLSIITVVFNNKHYLEKTIQSIISQTSKNYELIIIDGGSTDGTLNLIEQYSNHISYWISEPDKGIYDAMNKGLAAAQGRFVWFVNSGDEISDSEIVKRLEALPAADIYFGETILIDENSNRLGTRSELSTRKLPKVLTSQSLKQGMVVSHQAIIVKRQLAPYYNLLYKCSADIDWVIESLKRSKTIYNTHLELSKYLTGGYSIKNARRCLTERFRVFMHHYGFILASLYHIKILFRALTYRLTGRPNY